MAANDGFPVVRHASSDIAGYPTEVRVPATLSELSTSGVTMMAFTDIAAALPGQDGGLC